MSRLDPADLNARMGSYFTAHVASSDPSGLVPIALDGKMLRGALRAKATATHLVSVFAHRARLVLGQLAVAEKAMKFPAYVPCSRCCRITCGGWSPWMRCIPRSSPRS
ncbi:transposase family protein [Mycobacterium ulcerans str. Harvey]|uniref:Transposase family protein n=1 Tax=Mycobacterium ulcerans str. Harvey TaxID=1299332 RepID=A0ABN0RAT3_MYCUL|nr:transposase family protein [Mycobacterium ulcerans str. Harvey]EUA94239.1 transposase family protein [Mycobacterium ulcerans str. Harvey]